MSNRIALGLQYDGSRFHGWQAQTGLRTVQQELQRAISSIANENLRVHCAGRTDTGVHALEQVLHFDTNAKRDLNAWLYGVNSHLPHDIVIRWAKEVSFDFDARRSATLRHYHYVIYNHPIRTAVLTQAMTWQYRPLEHNLMHQAAQDLVGEHDFTSYRAIGCQSRTPMRAIKEFSVTRRGDWVFIDVKANAFLHHMVRNMVGVLMVIGSGKRPVTWAKEVLLARDRSLGAETAPPYGLYLLKIEYPSKFGLPQHPVWPLF